MKTEYPCLPENTSSQTRGLARNCYVLAQFLKNTSRQNLKCPHTKAKNNHHIEKVWAKFPKRSVSTDSVNKTFALVRSMTWREFAAGIRLIKSGMQDYEAKLERMPGLERWFVDIVTIGAVNVLSMSPGHPEKHSP